MIEIGFRPEGVAPFNKDSSRLGIFWDRSDTTKFSIKCIFRHKRYKIEKALCPFSFEYKEMKLRKHRFLMWRWSHTNQAFAQNEVFWLPTKEHHQDTELPATKDSSSI